MGITLFSNLVFFVCQREPTQGEAVRDPPAPYVCAHNVRTPARTRVRTLAHTCVHAWAHLRTPMHTHGRVCVCHREPIANPKL